MDSIIDRAMRDETRQVYDANLKSLTDLGESLKARQNELKRLHKLAEQSTTSGSLLLSEALKVNEILDEIYNHAREQQDRFEALCADLECAIAMTKGEQR